MAYTETFVSLMNIPLQNDYQHTYAWKSVSEQTLYFRGRTSKDYNNCTYQRKDNVIRVPDHIDNLYQYNYVMYINLAYSNKVFYAFIKELVYVNDGRTDIIIETDVLQTWYFEHHVGNSFIEREHVKDDTIGAHTIHENVDRGEYVVNGYDKVDELVASRTKVVMGSTYDPFENEESVGGLYNGIYSGVKYYVLPTDNKNDNSITKVLQTITDKGKADAVTSLFMAPDFVLTGGEDGGTIDGTTGAMYIVKEVEKNYGFEGYEPKNNKLKTMDYTYLLVSNGNGATAEYGYEYFETEGDCSFQIIGAITPGCSIRLRPTIYKGQQMYELEGLNGGKYPQCNWATDQFTNWLTQNAVNMVGDALTGVAGLAMGFMTMGPAGLAMAGVSAGVQTANNVNETIKAARVPPQARGNLNCGDVVNAAGENTFHFYNMSIKKEFAKMIDSYFNMYGYKVNRLGTPYSFHRERWWYTKLIDANVYGAIPKDDLNKIKDAYNNGITFWKTPDLFRVYTSTNGELLNNAIVTE